MQNFPFYVVSNFLRLEANRRHSAGRFPPSSWHLWARAAGQSRGAMSDEMASELPHFPLFPPCLLLSHSLFPLNTPLELKASLVLSMEVRMQVQRHPPFFFFFFFHLSEKNPSFWHRWGNGFLPLRAGTVRGCQFSTLPFCQTYRCLPLRTFPNTKHCHHPSHRGEKEE